MNKQNELNEEEIEQITGEYLSLVDIPFIKRNGYDPDFVDHLLDCTSAKLRFYEGKYSAEQMEAGMNAMQNQLNEEMGGKPTPEFSDVAGSIPDIEETDEEEAIGNEETEKLQQDLALARDEFMRREEEYKALLAEKDREITMLEDDCRKLAEQVEKAQAQTVTKDTHTQQAEEATGIIAHAVRLSEEAVNKAHAEAQNIISAAHETAEALKHETENELRTIRYEVSRMKDKRAAFLSQMRSEVDSLATEIDSYTNRHFPIEDTTA